MVKARMCSSIAVSHRLEEKGGKEARQKRTREKRERRGYLIRTETGKAFFFFLLPRTQMDFQ